MRRWHKNEYSRSSGGSGSCMDVAVGIVGLCLGGGAAAEQAAAGEAVRAPTPLGLRV